MQSAPFDWTLLSATSMAWVDAVLSDFPSFIVDHASCERKASAVGMSFVVRYPDRTALLEPMIHFAREELEHFHQVIRLMTRLGLSPLPDQEDEYVNILMKACRTGRDERFLDRLLISSAIEARGAERLLLIAEHLPTEELRNFYGRLARAEVSHKNLFVDIALKFFDAETVKKRLDELLAIEDRAIRSVPIRALVH